MTAQQQQLINEMAAGKVVRAVRRGQGDVYAFGEPYQTVNALVRRKLARVSGDELVLTPSGAAKARPAPPAKATTGAMHPVARARREQALTQAQVAEAAGFTQAYIASVESGARLASSFAVIAKMAKALGVPPRELVGDMMDWALSTPQKRRIR